MNPTWLYVGALYAVAVFIARRLRADFPWRIAAFFYALVLIHLFRPMTGPYVNLPVDILTTLPPWSGVLHQRHVSNSILNDLVMQIVPWAQQVRVAYRSGHLPLWNALSGSGYPLLGSAQSSALSPLRLLALPLSLGDAFTAEAAMKMLMAMSFMYGFCRRRWSELPSAIGAVCFAFCTFVQVWLHFPLATAAVWVPAAILSIDLLLERVTRLRIAGMAAAWGTMLLTGHPETAAHTAFIAALYIAWILGVERPLPLRDAARRIGALAVATIIAVLIASPFLAPFAEGIRKSKRYQELEARPSAIGYFSDWPSAIILLEPNFFGHLPEDRTWPQASAESITAFAGILGAGAWLGLLLRAIIGRRWREREMFFVIATPIILGIILAWPGVSTLFHLLFKFAANARLRLMLCWTVAAMTAAIVDLALRGERIYLLAGSAAAALALLVLLNAVTLSPVGKDIAFLAIAPSLVVIAASTLFAFPRSVRLSACVVFVAVIAELWSATRSWNPVLPKTLMYPSTPLVRYLQAHAPAEHFRVAGLQAMLFPNTQAMYGLAEIRAHDPMAIARYLGILRAVAAYDTNDYFAKWTDSETPLLDYLNVKYVVTEPAIELANTRHALVYQGKDGRVYQNRDVLPRFFPVRATILAFRRSEFVHAVLHHTAWHDTAIVNVLPVENDRMRYDFLHQPPPGAQPATLHITSASATEYTMQVHAPRYTLVVSSIPLWPGWRVERNGKNILARPVNGAFLGFIAPPGDSVVRVYYRPMTFYVAAVVSLLTIVAVAVWVGQRTMISNRPR